MGEPGGQGSKRKITIAVEGCCHGELDKIYATMQFLEAKEGRKIDLLLCCGDFQAVRNLDDLETMACPAKYRALNTFYKYYSGEAVAPYPTIFIGGNHEASNYLWELYYGGWAAPNIWFMGFAGAIKFGGLRIAGLSGIYKNSDYSRGHHEALPYNDSTMRSIYHVRDFEVYRLMQIKRPVDVFLSHDWPKNIVEYGDKASLLRKKPFLQEDIASGSLGSAPGEQILAALQPSHWFSAHLHTKFPALMRHPSESIPGGPVTATATGKGGGGVGHGNGSSSGGGLTRFLALDKCLPGRDFLQVLEMEVDDDAPLELAYDEEWLAVLRSTRGLTNLGHRRAQLPGYGVQRSGPAAADVAFVKEALRARGGPWVDPLSFVQTAPPHDAQAAKRRRPSMPTAPLRNPQTEALLQLLGLPYDLDHAAGSNGGGKSNRQGVGGGGGSSNGQQEEGLGVLGGFGSGGGGRMAGLGTRRYGGLAATIPPPAWSSQAATAMQPAIPNPEEIDLDDAVDDDVIDDDDALDSEAALAAAIAAVSSPPADSLPQPSAPLAAAAKGPS